MNLQNVTLKVNTMLCIHFPDANLTLGLFDHRSAVFTSSLISFSSVHSTGL
ncbi:MAG TPA: hypothetical protein PK509_07190 [Catalimonadaceae bacterium]|nr:hypothetical protein [Catalimonadaceae bacterium]